MLSVEAYYPEGLSKDYLVNTYTAANTITYRNTMTLTFDFVDESGYSDSITQVIKLRN